MKIMRMSGGIVILSLICLTITIQRECRMDQQCPQNSFCSINFNTCRCTNDFIGQCNISAVVLTNETFKTELKNSAIQYFSIAPFQVNRFIDIRINLCQTNTQESIMAYLWGQTGREVEFNTNATLVSPMNITFQNICSHISISSIYFYAQTNGDSQKLVLGLLSINQQNLGLSISVDQNDTLELFISRYFAIGVMMLLLFSLCGCMLINIFRRVRRLHVQRIVSQMQNNEHEDYNIDYFEQYLPKKRREEVSDSELVCPICLQHVQINDFTRKTPCQHIFHSDCLDCWCKKNANCPVCRFDLSYEFIKAIHDSMNGTTTNQSGGYTKHWEEDIELQERYTGDHSTIRDEML